ncbi:MAG: dnaG, partial [Pedosphaera sp.]|nr:dnaG [Pedosphaera sp.]
MAGFFDSNSLEQVRAASDIVDVIGSYVPLKRAGANFTALCPFHKEKSPSFNVNPQKQIFHCFGCHKGGDVFTFVKEYENIPFPDAVRRLADRAKIPLEMDNNPGQIQSRHLKDTLLQIHEQITQRWQSALTNDAAGQIARDYLEQRGVSAEAIKLFRLGYAPEVWDDTVNWAKSKGHELTLMEQAGLILRKEGGDHYYDRFRGRLIFPICDEQGRVIGFSGRVLSGDQKTAKYVNSPETLIFTKGKVFFGLDKSKRALLDAQSAIVCEGQLDLIACYMAGVQNIVAPQGTALTGDHARILKRYVEEVVLCFDSDNAGQNAAVRSLDSLLASGLAVRVAVVPAPHDPDSFIKEAGGAAFKELIEQANGFFDYYLGRLCATNDLTSDKGRLAVLHAMAEAVHKTGNVVLVDTYAQKTALRLGVSPEAVRAEFKKASRLKGASPVVQEEEQEIISSQATPASPEYWLLKLIFLHEETLEWIHAHLDP